MNNIFTLKMHFEQRKRMFHQQTRDRRRDTIAHDCLGTTRTYLLCKSHATVSTQTVSGTQTVIGTQTVSGTQTASSTQTLSGTQTVMCHSVSSPSVSCLLMTNPYPMFKVHLQRLYDVFTCIISNELYKA